MTALVPVRHSVEEGPGSGNGRHLSLVIYFGVAGLLLRWTAWAAQPPPGAPRSGRGEAGLRGFPGLRTTAGGDSLDRPSSEGAAPKVETAPGAP